MSAVLSVAWFVRLSSEQKGDKDCLPACSISDKDCLPSVCSISAVLSVAWVVRLCSKQTGDKYSAINIDLYEPIKLPS